MPSVEDGNKKYIIRDAIHGYVEIGSAIVKDVIDTPSFQRLLRIQQTNLSVLYPSATHTRFEHSLGVFFLGKFSFRRDKFAFAGGLEDGSTIFFELFGR